MKARKLLMAVAAIMCAPLMGVAQTNSLPATGNVGIGTATPQCALEVKGEAAIDGKMRVDSAVLFKDNLKLMGNLKLKNMADSNAEPYRLLYVNEQGKVKNGSLLDLPLVEEIYRPKGCSPITVLPTWANDTSVLYVDCPFDSRVGIGTNNPKHKLSVIGDTYSSRGQFGTNADTVLNATGSSLYVHGLGNTSPMYVNHKSNADYQIAMVIRQDNPLTKAISVQNINPDSLGLEVFRVWGNGQVDARAFKVSHAIWADSVFAEEFELMPLQEVEKFISEFHHLPNVPSEEVVATEGYEVSDMMAVQMAKIEELTLYLLQMQKEIEALKATNEELKTQMNSHE